jgi:transposase
MYTNIILLYKEHLSKLESEIDALAKEVEEYTIIKSIPGIFRTFPHKLYKSKEV